MRGVIVWQIINSEVRINRVKITLLMLKSECESFPIKVRRAHW